MYHGKKTRAEKKRKYNMGGVFPETGISEEKKKSVPRKGSGKKTKLVSTQHVNLTDGGKNMKCEITGLEENPANKDYTRRKIITKGAFLAVKTPEGKEIRVRVSSRPGQDGVVNAKTV